MSDDGGFCEPDGAIERTDVSDAFELLRSPRRRDALTHLAEIDDEVVALDELAERVLEDERARFGGDESDGSDDTRDRRREIYNDLYHAHIPRLETAGIGTYEAGEDAVRVETIPEHVSALLALARRFESDT